MALLATPTSASTGQESQIQDDPLLVYETPAQVAATLDQMKALGVDRVRVTVLWRLVAPAATSQTKPAGCDGSNPEAYPGGTWNRFDAIVRLAGARGIAVHFNPTAPAPSWATGNTVRTDLEETYEPDAAEYAAFVTAAAATTGPTTRAPRPTATATRSRCRAAGRTAARSSCPRRATRPAASACGAGCARRPTASRRR